MTSMSSAATRAFYLALAVGGPACGTPATTPVPAVAPAEAPSEMPTTAKRRLRQALAALTNVSGPKAYEVRADIEGHYPSIGEIRTQRGRVTLRSAGAFDRLLPTLLEEALATEVSSSRTNGTSPELEVAFTLRGDRYHLELEESAGSVRVTRIERMFTHESRGDVADTITFAEWADGHPERITARIEDLHMAFTLELRPGRSPEPADPELQIFEENDLPRWSTSRTEERAHLAATAITTEMVGDTSPFGLALIPEHDLKVPFLVGKTGVVLYDAPLSSTLVEKLVEAVEASAKAPVVAAVLSHHHPHHMGGVRALVATGAKLFASSAVAQLIGERCKAKWTTPDRLANSPRPPDLVVVERHTTAKVAGIELRIVDLGGATEHTHDYLLMHHGPSQTAVVGDLLWQLPDPPARIKPRPGARAVFTALQHHELATATILQTWPLDKQPRALSFAALESAFVEEGASK